MTDEDRKYLTEKMGECWHGDYRILIRSYMCGKCRKINADNRTFDTWPDFGAVLEYATAQEWWPKFLDHHVKTKLYAEEDFWSIHKLFAWLIDKDRFSTLLVGFLRERKTK